MREYIQWQPCEWAEGGTSAYLSGYEANVYPDERNNGSLVWTVTATAEVSEWPELQAIGFPRSIETGQRAAERALRHAAAARRVA